MIDLDSLRALVDRGEGRDRAFVDAMIRLRWARVVDPREREDLAALHREVREVSLERHAGLRIDIASGALRGAALRSRFDEIPELERDHFVEEVLGIAYPPLDEQALEPELIAYTPSGYDEIVHALDATRLGRDDRFLDLGSGTGKAVMLAALLTGATSLGVERDGALHELATSAARSLALEVRLHHADVRDLVPEADVVFMYLPFTGTVLAKVMSRLMERPPRFLCGGALDTRHYRELIESGPSRSWLHVYAAR